MASRTNHPKPLQLARRLALILLVVGLTTLLGSCAAGANSASASGASNAGFLLGVWHGFIAPIAFLVSLFNHTVGIYEIHNTGAWYDVGFLIGISAFFSGPAGAARRSRSGRRSRP